MCSFPDYIVKGGASMKEEYINAITSLINQCQDIELLDLIFRLLKHHG